MTTTETVIHHPDRHAHPPGMTLTCSAPGQRRCTQAPIFTLDYGTNGTTVCFKHLAVTLLWCSERQSPLLVMRIPA